MSWVPPAERVGFRFGSAVCPECGRRIAVRPVQLWWMSVSPVTRAARYFYVHKGRPHPIGKGRALCSGSGQPAADVTPGWDA